MREHCRRAVLRAWFGQITGGFGVLLRARFPEADKGLERQLGGMEQIDSEEAIFKSRWTEAGSWV